MRNFSPQAQIALQKLKDLIDCYVYGEKNSETVQATQLQRKNEIQGLRSFTNDAYQFVRNSTEYVAHWPLQLYFSAISFEQHNNAIRDTFEQAVRRIFGPCPILASKQHGQSSFRLQNTFKADTKSHPMHVIIPKMMVFSPSSSLIGGLYEAFSVDQFAVWRAETGALEHNFDIIFNSRIAFFPNSGDFISISEDGIMNRWSMNKRSCVGRQSLNFDIPGDKVIALSPKGDLVASWHCLSTDGLGFAKVWDTYTACCQTSCDYGEAKDIYAAFSPNSQLLAVLYRGGFGVHDAKTGAMVQHINIDVKETYLDERFGNLYNSDCICFSLNSKILATTDRHRQIYLWNTHTWEPIRKIEMSPFFNSLQCLAISPDCTILATGLSDGTRLWSIETGECVARVNINSWLIVFPPDWTESSRVALQSREGDVQTWLISNNQTIPMVQHLSYNFDSINISPDSRFIALTRSYIDDIEIWSVDDGQILHVLEGQYGELKEADHPPVFSPDSKLLAFTNGLSKIQTWSVATGQLVCSLDCEDKSVICSIALSSDPKCLIAGTLSGEMYIWRIASHQLIYKYDKDNKNKRLKRPLLVAISPESAHIAAFWQSEPLRSWSSYVRTWHLCTTQNMKISLQQAWTHQALKWIFDLRGEALIAFSSDSAVLATITASDAQIFDVVTGTCLLECDLGASDIRLLSFDAIKGQLFYSHFVFHKTSSWKHWQASPRLGYSYNYLRSDAYTVDDKWIALDGKMNCYLPSNFRLGKLTDSGLNPLAAMSDSLLVVVNQLREVVIIKFPTPCEAWQHDKGNFDVAPPCESASDSAGGSNVVFSVSTERNARSESTVRKKSAWNKLKSWG